MIASLTRPRTSTLALLQLERPVLTLLAALAVLTALAVSTVTPVDAATTPRRLGGFNLAADCRWYFNDPSARAYANDSDPYSWVCVTVDGVFPIHQHLFNVFAVHQYGSGAYAVLEGPRPTDWAAYRDAQRLGGFNLAADCRWYFGDANARAYSNDSDPYSWVCVTVDGIYPITQHLFNIFAVHEHGEGAFAVLEGSRPTDWAAYR